MDNSDFINQLTRQNDKRVIFALVDPAFKNITEQNGITYFPDVDSLRVFRFGKKNVISLQELPDPKCKKCYGTGKCGTVTKQVNILVEEIAQLIESRIKNDSDSIPQKLIDVMRLSPNLIKPLTLLVNVIVADIEKVKDEKVNIHDKIILPYARMIKRDCTITSIVWCNKCFIPNLKKAQDEVRLNIKFGVN